MTAEPPENAPVTTAWVDLSAPLPPFVRAAGAQAEAFTREFFAARISNRNTRAAYESAVRRFGVWCQGHGLELFQVNPIHAAAYVDKLGRSLAAPSVNLHLAALRQWFDWLTQRGLFRANPIASVKAPATPSTKARPRCSRRRRRRRSSRPSGMATSFRHATRRCSR